MNWIENLAITIILGILQNILKGRSVGVAESVVEHVRDDSTLALLAMNPNAPPPPGYVLAGPSAPVLPFPSQTSASTASLAVEPKKEPQPGEAEFKPTPPID